MIDILGALQAVEDAPDDVARVRLRVVGIPRGGTPVLGPSGQPLTTCTAPVPLTPDGRAALEAWAAEAAGAEWPAGARIRLDLEDGAAKPVSGCSRSWTPAAVTGRAPTPGGPSARPAWTHPPPAESAPSADLQLGLAPSLQLAGFALGLVKDVVLESMRGAQRLASEAVAQSGQTARTQSAQLGQVTSTVARASTDQLADRREAEAEARAAQLQAAEAQALAAALEARLEAALERAGDSAGSGAPGATGPASGAPDRRAAMFDRGVDALLGAVLGGGVKLQTTGTPVGPGLEVLEARQAAPAAPQAAQAAQPAPAWPQAAQAAQAPQAGPADGPSLEALLEAGSAGDLQAQAEARRRLQALGGLAGLAWVAAGQDG
jgi:hypothetical protein